MIVYFSSVSEFTHNFIQKLDLPAKRIPISSKEIEKFIIDEEYVLIFPTYGAGSKGFVPKQVIKFLNNEHNRSLLCGIIGTGNTNFGVDYCEGARIVAAKCEKPLLYKLEISGTNEDVVTVREGLKRLWKTKQITVPSTQN